MASAAAATADDDDDELKRKIKIEEEKQQYIRQIQDELNLPISDPIRESTVDYYLQNKDKVSLCNMLSLFSLLLCKKDI